MGHKFLLENPVWILTAVSLVYALELSLHIYEH